MNKGFVNKLLTLENTTQVVRAMMERRDEILQAIEAGTIQPGSDVVAELAELNIAIGDFEADKEGDHGNQ